jgi:Pyruvate/2-oxoacid:ferredoxin oxidoreductase gamma subunit
VAEITVSPDKIDYTGIAAADYFVVLSEDGVRRTRARIEKLPASCTLYAEESLELPATQAQVRRYPFVKVGRQVNKLAVATAAMAALVADSGILPKDAFAHAIWTFQKPAIAEINLKAVEAGVALTGGHHNADGTGGDTE